MNKILEVIKRFDNIVITGHKSPDGDAFGACIALKYILKKIGKKSVVVFMYEIPEYMTNLGYINEIEKEINVRENSLLISLDTANYERLAISDEELIKFKYIINMDHHISNTNYGNLNYVQEISSASELVYNFLKFLDVELDKDIATMIYLGIINDTGNFRHSNTTRETFLAASDLIQYGIDNSNIFFELYGKNEKKTRLFGEAMLNFEVIEDLKFNYFYIPNEEIVKEGYRNEDIDGISEMLLMTKGFELSLLIKEVSKGIIRGSFRSKKINVSKLCSELFGGGGHVKASGFTTTFNKKEIIEKIVEYVRNNEKDTNI